MVYDEIKNLAASYEVCYRSNGLVYPERRRRNYRSPWAKRIKSPLYHPPFTLSGSRRVTMNVTGATINTKQTSTNYAWEKLNY